MKELAPEEASIARYSDFESDRRAVRRLRRRASGGESVKNTKLFEILRFLQIHQFHVNLENSLEFLEISLDCLKFFKHLTLILSPFEILKKEPPLLAPYKAKVLKNSAPKVKIGWF